MKKNVLTTAILLIPLFAVLFSALSGCAVRVDDNHPVQHDDHDHHDDGGHP